MITNQVTSIEQSERLIELGIPKEKASLVWTTVNDNETVVERDLCLPENIEGYAFTVADLMSILPKDVIYKGRKCLFFVTERSEGISQVWVIYFGSPKLIDASKLNMEGGAIHIISAKNTVSVLCDAIEWVYGHSETIIVSDKNIGEKNEQWIAEYLKGKDYTSPTEIGRAHANAFNIVSLTHHSAWASPICKRMVEKGILLRNDKGKYKLK